MSGQWIKDIEIGSLLEPFNHFSAYEIGISTTSTGNDTNPKDNYELLKLNPKTGLNNGVWSQ